MEYYTIPAGPFEVNTYLVFSGGGNRKEGFILDPGGQAERIDSLIKKENIEPKFILNTHCHVDHVMMDNYFKGKYGLKIFANAGEEANLKNIKNSALYFGFDFEEEIKIDRYLVNGEIIRVGNMEIKTIFTPGHSPGSTSFLVDAKYLFSGDTIFQGTIGRTDLLGGSSADIIKSIKERLLPLGDEVIILPGHGEPSTIADEKKYNPYLI